MLEVFTPLDKNASIIRVNIPRYRVQIAKFHESHQKIVGGHIRQEFYVNSSHIQTGKNKQKHFYISLFRLYVQMPSKIYSYMLIRSY